MFCRYLMNILESVICFNRLIVDKKGFYLLIFHLKHPFQKLKKKTRWSEPCGTQVGVPKTSEEHIGCNKCLSTWSVISSCAKTWGWWLDFNIHGRIWTTTDSMALMRPLRAHTSIYICGKIISVLYPGNTTHAALNSLSSPLTYRIFEGRWFSPIFPYSDI